MGAEKQGVGEGSGRWEKNSLGRKLTIYGGRWEKGLEMGDSGVGVLKSNPWPPLNNSVSISGMSKNCMNSEVIILNIYDDGKVILISNIVSLR